MLRLVYPVGLTVPRGGSRSAAVASRANRGVRGTTGVLDPGPRSASSRPPTRLPGPYPAPHFTGCGEAQSARLGSPSRGPTGPWVGCRPGSLPWAAGVDRGPRVTSDAARTAARGGFVLPAGPSSSRGPRPGQGSGCPSHFVGRPRAGNPDRPSYSDWVPALASPEFRVPT